MAGAQIQRDATKREIADAIANAFLVLMNHPEDQGRQAQAAKELYSVFQRLPQNDPTRANPEFGRVMQLLEIGRLGDALRLMMSISRPPDAQPLERVYRRRE